MKIKTTIALFILFSITTFGQNLPIFNLREEAISKFEFPESFETNEIGVILKQTHGWSAFDNITYYIFKNNGTIIAYSKQTPKSYLKKYNKLQETTSRLELNTEQSKKLIGSLNSRKTSDFLKYTQKDFKTSDLSKVPICIYNDALGYTLIFIQNKNENSYSYYAPEYYLKSCNDKSINKIMLQKFIDLIQLWKI